MIPRRPAAALAILPAAALLALAPRVTAGAASCPALDYRAGVQAAALALRQTPVDAATAQREAVALGAAYPGAAIALKPVLSDLGASPPALDDARLRLGTMSAALAYPAGSVCGSGSAAARSALGQVYASPDLRHLDDSTQPGVISSILGAVARFVGSAAGTLGPTGAILFGLVLAGVPLVLALLRWRGSAAARDARVAEPAETGDDPEAEWRLAERAAAAGDHREAVRRAFRAALLAVARRGRLHLDAAWTTRELLQRCDAEGDVLAALAAAAALFERAWYSGAAVAREDWLRARDRCATVRQLVASAPVRPL